MNNINGKSNKRRYRCHTDEDILFSYVNFDGEHKIGAKKENIMINFTIMVQ